MADPREVLEQSTTIAVVGMSTDPQKESHSVPLSLREAGFELQPVHPKADRIAGMDVHPSLADLPEPPDAVQVFRPAEEAAGIAEQAAAVGAKALWLQVGITSPEARSIATKAGMAYVEDDCMGQVRDRHDIRKG